MFTATEQFITQMKFRELRTQRDKSLAAYDGLRRELAAAPTDAARVRVLYRGLRRLQFAKQPLHPDVANLELILRDADQYQVSTETIAFWRTELEHELSRGQMRSESVYTFGALLEEWTIESARTPEADPAQREAQAALLQRIGQPAPTNSSTAFLSSLYERLGVIARDELTDLARKAAEEKVYAGVKFAPHGGMVSRRMYGQHNESELESILEQIQKDTHRSGSIRSQAQRFLLNPTLMKELADALTILLDHIDEWDWPQSGVPARTLLARRKWRLFLDEDLPTACLLELLGRRWQQALGQIWGGKQADRIARLQRLQELGAPMIILQNERMMLSKNARPGAGSPVDIWTDPAEETTKPSVNLAGASEAELSLYWGEPGSIVALRAQAQDELRSFDRFDGYNGEEVKGGMGTVLGLVNAEIALGRAAFPDQPLYIVKIDLRDFYPSIPHDVILSVLSRFGLAERDVEFFRRYLRTRIAADSDTLTAQSGMPIHRGLSYLLGELVLMFLEQYVQQQARTQVIRLIDDICLITASADEAVKAWDAVQAFCAGCGLSVNEEKCGAVCIGGELPQGLPTGQASWLLLTLDSQGQWTVDEEEFADYLDQVRQQISQITSIMARVDCYNANLYYLEHALALKVYLGETHRRSVRDAVWRFHSALFSDSEGIVESVRQAIRERFVEEDSAIPLPEAWLYWPITAGGLGLRQAILRAASYSESFARRKQVAPPTERASDWQRRANGWAQYYGSLLDEVSQVQPAPNKVMETLVKDFINRGADLSAGKQQTLSTYWRWILYIYGPQILDAFGTFRFLFSELVPLQLITGRHLADDQADGEDLDG